jgi:hypothetical protein
LLGIAYQPSWFEVSAHARASLPRESTLPRSSGNVRSTSVGGGVDVCAVPTLASFQLRGCVEGSLEFLIAEGEGTARDSSATIPLYAVGPFVGARWLLSEHAFVSVGFGARWFLKRPELLVDGLPERRRVEAVTLDAQLGGGVRW